MSFQQNINRLGKLVPVYVISFLGAVTSFFQLFYEEDPMYARWAIIVIVGISVILTLVIETVVLKRKKIIQIIIAVISGALWIFFINLRFFDFENILELTIQFVTTIYTFLIALFSQYLTEDAGGN
ncbi:MAG: hypothetical protein ACFFG0_40085 [Candidatus Thorarchaeota archaeon]